MASEFVKGGCRMNELKPMLPLTADLREWTQILARYREPRLRAASSSRDYGAAVSPLVSDVGRARHRLLDLPCCSPCRPPASWCGSS